MRYFGIEFQFWIHVVSDFKSTLVNTYKHLISCIENNSLSVAKQVEKLKIQGQLECDTLSIDL